MKIVQGITKIFNDIQKNHQLRKRAKGLKKEISEAIENEDVGAAKVAVKELTKTKLYWSKCRTDHIESSIGKDNIDLLSVFINIKNKPNYKLHYRQHFHEMGYNTIEQSLLYTAIECKAQSIALALAKNPKTDIEASGYEYQFRLRGGGMFSSSHRVETTTTFLNPLKLARKMKMPEVVAVLAERKAELLRQDAAKLQAEANKLAP